VWLVHLLSKSHALLVSSWSQVVGSGYSRGVDFVVVGLILIVVCVFAVFFGFVVVRGFVDFFDFVLLFVFVCLFGFSVFAFLVCFVVAFVFGLVFIVVGLRVRSWAIGGGGRWWGIGCKVGSVVGEVGEFVVVNWVEIGGHIKVGGLRGVIVEVDVVFVGVDGLVVLPLDDQSISLDKWLALV
jgi:hypothetical protein